MEFFLSLLIPITTTLFMYPVVTLNNELSRLNFAIKLCLSLALGSSLLIVLLSLWAMLIPAGFSTFSKALFIITLAMTCIALRKIFSQENFLSEIQKIIKGVLRDHTYWMIVTYIFFFLILFILRPVVDADIIDTYLPFARSIILAEKIPVRNYYDNTALIVPPIGGPIYFAYFYAVSGNIQGEVFRFINLPFFFGYLVLSYFIMRKYLTHKIAILGLLMVLSIPFMEDMIFTAGIYPDFIFSFMSLICLWGFDQSIDGKKRADLNSYLYILGLNLAAMLLIKYQGIFFWLLIFMILGLMYLKGKWKFMVLPIVYSPFLLQRVVGIYFGKYDQITWITFLVVMGISSLIGLKWSKYRQNKFHYSLLIFVLLMSLGTAFIIRNYLIFGGLIDKSVDGRWLGDVQKSMNLQPEGGNNIKAWAYFLDPALGLFFLAPKIIGIWTGLSEKKFFFPNFILIAYYAMWVIFLGSTSIRWLIPIFPYLSLLTLIGLDRLITNYNNLKKIIWGSIPFSILSSKFIFWNIAVLHLGNADLRKAGSLLESVPNIEPLIKIISEKGFQWISQWAIRLIYILTSRGDIFVNDVILLLVYGIITFVIVILTLRFLKTKLYIRAVLLLLVLSYGYIFIRVSGGNLLEFSKKEQNLVFDYWGQSTYLVPYIKQRAKSDDKIIVFSAPTGLSYYTNMRAYNMEYGNTVSIFQPIYYESSLEEIYKYYKKNQIRYVAVRNFGISIARFNGFKKNTKIFDILNQEKYAKLLIKPNGNNYWYLYEII